MASAICYLDARSALGSSLSESIDNLMLERKAWQWKDVNFLQEPLRLPYFGLKETTHTTNTSGENAAGIYETLQEMVGNAINALSLSPQQLARTGILIGSSSFDVAVSEQIYHDAITECEADPLPMCIIGYGKLPDALSKQFNLSSFCYSYSTACTSGANALLYAHRMLDAGLIDHAIVIGMEFFNYTSLLGFYSLGLISPSQSLKPFSQNRDGLVLGEAISLAVLRRESANNTLLSICGGAINTDNHSLTAAISDGSTLADVIQSALADAQVTPEMIKGVKTHGTASLMNDEAEAAGLHRIFSPVPYCFALKPFCGHTLGASGVLELALTCGSLMRRNIPCNPGQVSDIALGITLNDANTPALDGHYLLNCFAFGGNNNALILQFNSQASESVLCS